MDCPPLKKAIYPGSFDPITNGHIDIAERALQVFDEVYLAVFVNPEKNPLFNESEKIELIKSIFKKTPRIHVVSFKGLLSEYANQTKIYTIIRGLRAVSDFDYEFQFALTNRKLNSKLETIFLMTDSRYAYLSSSLVKQLVGFSADISPFVPKQVEEALKRKMT